MDPGIPFADLLAYNSAENAHWKRWFAEHAAALDLPCDVAGAGTVRNLLLHIFATELFFANRVLDLPKADYQTLPRAASDLSASAGIQAGLDARLNRQQSHGLSSLQLQRLQVVAECLTQFFPLQRHLNGSFQESELVAGIVAAPFVDIGINALLFEQRL